jgi:dsRNA-specific ribonuclease
MKPLIEDVFEAFLGCTEYILDNEFRPGVGYAIVHDILSSIFDSIDISLEYNKLYDAKTRLKELFDSHNLINDMITKYGSLKQNTQRFIDYDNKFGQIQYVDSYTEDEKRVSKVIYKTKKHGEIILGTGYANLKQDAQQYAAENALNTLKLNGIEKEIPNFYKKI